MNEKFEYMDLAHAEAEGVKFQRELIDLCKRYHYAEYLVVVGAPISSISLDKGDEPLTAARAVLYFATENADRSSLAALLDAALPRLLAALI